MCLKSEVINFIRDLYNIFPYFTPSDPIGFVDKWCDELIRFPLESIEFCLQDIQYSQRKYLPSLPEIIWICKKYTSNREQPNFDFVNRFELLKTNASNGIFEESEWIKLLTLLNETGKRNLSISVEKHLIFWRNYYESTNLIPEL